MREPWFWREESIAAHAASALMAPAAIIYDAAQRFRSQMTTPARAQAPVVCVGNATLGGVGKTPFALTLQRLLKDRGVRTHFSSRGFGGALAGPVRVSAEHTASEVGDEALLLAAAAPTWVSKNRLAGARAASDGADVVIMDDGFQNPTIAKDAALLLVDAADPCGNGRVFPAGPMREPLARAVARADAVILIGAGPSFDAGEKPVFRVGTATIPPAAQGKYVAFCGVARPERFFAGLSAAGVDLAGAIPFADHHAFGPDDLAALRAKAKKAGAALVATEKDLARIPPELRMGIEVAKLEMTIDDAAGLYDLLAEKIGSSL